MKAVVLVAGSGTRLRPFSYTRPKHMIPLAGKPMLHHLLENIKKAGIDEIILVVGYKGDYVKSYFGDGKKFGLKIDYCTQEKQKGTGHAFLQAQQLVGESEFIGINGDDIYHPKDIGAIANYPTSSTVAAAKYIDDPKGFGVFEIKEDKIISLEEKPAKPKSNFVNTGLYRFTPDIFKKLKGVRTSLLRGEIEVTEALKACIKEGTLKLYKMKGYWQSMSNLWNVLEVNSVLLPKVSPRQEGTVERGATVVGEVCIGKGTVIRAGSYIKGPVYIGENCEIGPFAYIHSSTSIGNNCKLGRVEVKNSVIFDNVSAKHFTYLGDSIIGEGSNFGAGSKVANLKHDKSGIMVEVNGRLTNSRRYKLGAIIGDHSKLGVNCSILPGRIIGPFSWTDTSSVVDKTVKPGHILLRNGKLVKLKPLFEKFRKAI